MVEIIFGMHKDPRIEIEVCSKKRMQESPNNKQIEIADSRKTKVLMIW